MIQIDKKPRLIIVCGHEVEVKYRKRLAADGFFHPDKNTIEIKNGPEWKATLLHEFLHAAFWYTGHSQKFKEEEEEALVRALENAFVSLRFFN